MTSQQFQLSLWRSLKMTTTTTMEPEKLEQRKQMKMKTSRLTMELMRTTSMTMTWRSLSVHLSDRRHTSRACLGREYRSCYSCITTIDIIATRVIIIIIPANLKGPYQNVGAYVFHRRKHFQIWNQRHCC